MRRGVQGSLVGVAVTEEPFQAFVPFVLPPKPEIAFTSELRKELSKADQMVGRLDGLSTLIRHPEMLISFYIRKEAVLSSQIEGTQSTLTDLLLYEIAPETGNNDTLEVLNYVQAMRHGLKRLQEGFPLSLRLIREMHSILLQSGRGSRSTPGEFRTSQNWIGGTRPGNALYVPPPVPQMQDSLHAFEIFLHSGAADFEVLVQCALLHVQFETIHPFLDGNGRLGRLLITLLLIERGVLKQPLLYVSLYLKQNRAEYYDFLQRVRFDGDWEQWILFFLRGVSSTAEKANELAKNLLMLLENDERLLADVDTRKRGSAIQVLSRMKETPYTSPARLTEATGLAFNTVISSLELLTKKGILQERSGLRGRLYLYSEYLRLMEEGTALA